MAEQNQTMEKREFNRTFASNTAMSMVSTIVYLFTRMVVPPITLNYLGVEIYGIWAFCFVIVGYLGMSAFGISNVYIRCTAIFRSQNDTDAISRLVSTGLALTVPASLLIMIGLWYLMPSVIDFFKISEVNRDMAFQLFYGTAVIFLVQLAAGAFDCVLSGLQQIFLSKSVNIVASILETLSLFLCLRYGLGYISLIVAFSVRCVIFVCATFVLMRRSLPDLRIGPSYVDRSYFHHFFGYGGAMQFNGMLTMFVGTMDRVIFLRIFGEKLTGLLDIGQKFPRMAVFIPDSISGVIYPAVTHLQQGNQHDEIEKLYLRGCRYINKIIAVLMGFMASFSGPTLLLWLGPTSDLHLAAFFMILYTVPFHMHVLTGPASAVFKGLGKPFMETRYPVFKLIALILFIGVAMLVFGSTTTSISVATALAMSLSAIAYVIYANISLQIRQWPFLIKVFLPAFVPYLIGFCLYLATQALFVDHMNRIQLALRLVPIGLAYVLACVLYIWFFSLELGEKHQIKTKLLAIRKRLIRR